MKVNVKALIVATSVICYLLGVLTILCAKTIAALILSVLLLIWLSMLAVKAYEVICRQKSAHMKILTIQTVDGYELKRADIHEAIEKLGYYEHEMEK